MSTTVDERAGLATRIPPTREVGAAALLATFAGVATLLPAATLALFSGMVSHAFTGLASLERVVSAVTLIPLLGVMAGAAAIGLSRRSPWGRRIGLVVAGLLVLSPVVAVASSLVVAGDGRLDEATGAAIGSPLDVVRYHFFWIPGGQLTFPFAVIAATVGMFAGWGLLTRPRTSGEITTGAVGGADAPSAFTTARRPSTAMALLFGLGIEALVPYLAWLASAPIVPAATASPGPVGAAQGPDIGAGLLYAIVSFSAAGGALVAARAIRSRSPIGPYVAPMAATVAGPWSALVLAATGVQALSSSDGPGPGVPATALGVGLLGLALVALISPLVVTVSVFVRRAWFPPAGGPTPRRAGRRLGRLERLAVGAGAVLIAPTLIGTGTLIVDPPAPQLNFGEVLLDERAYRHAAPITVDESTLTPVGSLAGWTSDLEISDPVVFTLPGYAVEQAIVVQGGPAEFDWSHGLFLPRDGSLDVPGELCRLVPLEDPRVFVDPCGPPSEVSLDGAAYYPVSEPGFVVVASDLEPLGASVAPNLPADPRVDLSAMAIRRVPQADAFALRIGSRIVLYRPVDRYVSAGEMCRYSPAAVRDPLAGQFEIIEKDLGNTGDIEQPDGDDVVPSGCGFPPSVWLAGVEYGRKDDLWRLLDVPRATLTAAGTAVISDPGWAAAEGLPRQIAFPPTIDATAYAIEGVDPARAIAFVVGERVLVMAPLKELFPIASGLCRYVRSEIAAEYAAGGEDLGCPS